LVLFGPPGAGKGTQSQLLIDLFGLDHVSSGDLFRQNLQRQTPLGLRAKEFMDQGVLVPDEVTIDIVLSKVMSIDPQDGFILDGFPRNTWQAGELSDALENGSRGLDKVVHIDVSEPELERRLGGRYVCRQCQSPYAQEAASRSAACTRCGGELYQRDDDRPDAVKRRIEVYRDETLPLLSYYRDRGLLVDVGGDASVDEVNIRIVDALVPNPTNGE
jgi:adenylate kinase